MNPRFLLREKLFRWNHSFQMHLNFFPQVKGRNFFFWRKCTALKSLYHFKVFFFFFNSGKTIFGRQHFLYIMVIYSMLMCNI